MNMLDHRFDPYISPLTSLVVFVVFAVVLGAAVLVSKTDDDADESDCVCP